MPMAQPSWSLVDRCKAELLGTFLLVFFGCGAVHVAVLADELKGLWQIAIVWGIAVMLAIYVVGGISAAHINPAITVALALWGRFSWRDVVPYILAQVLGAFAAAALLFLFFYDRIEKKEPADKGPRTEATAKCYGEFYSVSEPIACVAEVVGTAILALVVFAVTDPRNAGSPADKFAPVFIGLTVSVLIVVIAPLTQACFNPARDVGPRLFTAIAGWGLNAFPPNAGAFTVYVLSPILGACAGGGLSNYLWAKVPTPKTKG